MRDGWREVRLGEVLALDVEPVIVSPSTEYRLAGVYSFGRGLFRRDSLLGARTSYKQLHRLRKDQLVLSKLKAWEGAVAVVGEAFDGFVLSPEFPTFSITGDLEPAYLSLLCGEAGFWELLRLESRGVGGRRERVHPRRLLDVPVQLPPLAEQRRIVDLTLAAEEVHSKAIQLLDATRLAGDRLRDEVFNRLSSRAVRLQQRVLVTNGRQRSPKHESGEHMIRYIRAANVKDGRLVLDQPMYMNFTPTEQARYALVPGDVLVTEGCGSLRQIGASCQWQGEIAGMVCFQNHLLRLRSTDPVATQAGFVYQWALWAFRTGQFASLATGTSIFSLGVTSVAAMPFPDPSEADQLWAVALLGDAERVQRAAASYASAVSTARSHVGADLLSSNHQIPDSYDAFLKPAS